MFFCSAAILVDFMDVILILVGYSLLAETERGPTMRSEDVLNRPYSENVC